jgi:hypothetical protein
VNREAALDRHVSGELLLAIAEGDSDRSPSEAELTHAFSCEVCAKNLDELRQSLSLIQGGAELPMDADLGAAEVPNFESAMQSFHQLSPQEARARKFLILVAIICGVVALLGLIGSLFADELIGN